MPTAPPTACPCGGLRYAGQPCERCGKGRRRKDARKHAAARGYDYRWQQFRTNYLAQHPLCGDCEERGTVTAATDIHHKEKLTNSLELQYELENLMPLCHACHSKRTARGE